MLVDEMDLLVTRKQTVRWGRASHALCSMAHQLRANNSLVAGISSLWARGRKERRPTSCPG